MCVSSSLIRLAAAILSSIGIFLSARYVTTSACPAILTPAIATPHRIYEVRSTSARIPQPLPDSGFAVDLSLARARFSATLRISWPSLVRFITTCWTIATTVPSTQYRPSPAATAQLKTAEHQRHHQVHHLCCAWIMPGLRGHPLHDRKCSPRSGSAGSARDRVTTDHAIQ